MSGEFGTPIRPLTIGDGDRVIDAIVSSTLFESSDVEMLASLLAAHHAGHDTTGQRWLVHIEDGHVNGTVMYRPIEASDRAWDLTLIAVTLERQRSGIGHRLMSHVERELRGEDQRTLLVQTSALVRFAATRSFYGRLGYTERGRVPDYWAPGDAMVLFSKTLTAPPTERAVSS